MAYQYVYRKQRGPKATLLTKVKHKSFQIATKQTSKQKIRGPCHGPHSSPEKQLQSINTCVESYVYTITLIKRKKIIISFLKIEFDGPLLQKLDQVSFNHWGCFLPSLVEIVPVVLEKKTKIWSIGELIISPVSWNFQSLSVVEGHQTFIQAKFTEICCEAIRPSVSWKIYESHKCHLCAFTFPWRNWSLALHWNKPDSPSLQDVLCNVNGSG